MVHGHGCSGGRVISLEKKQLDMRRPFSWDGRSEQSLRLGRSSRELRTPFADRVGPQCCQHVSLSLCRCRTSCLSIKKEPRAILALQIRTTTISSQWQFHRPDSNDCCIRQGGCQCATSCLAHQMVATDLRSTSSTSLERCRKRRGLGPLAISTRDWRGRGTDGLVLHGVLGGGEHRVAHAH